MLNAKCKIRLRNAKSEIRNEKGFVAIVSILIISTISMFFAISMLTDGINNAALSVNSLNYENAHINMSSCLDDALMRIKREAQFSGALNYNLYQGNSCSSSIIWASETPVKTGLVRRQATLDVTGVSNNFTRKFRYVLNVLKFTVNHNDGLVQYMNTINIDSITEINS